MSTSIYVDLGAMHELVGQLMSIYSALDEAKETFADGGEVTGSAEVSNALHHFCTGWKDGRQTIKDEIAHLVDAAKGAAEDYQRMEAQLRESSSSAGVRTATR